MTYTVKKGDTLSAIAKYHGVTLSDLAEANHIKNVNLIFPGQVLLIPGNPDFSEIGKCVVACIKKIEELPEYQKLMELI